MPYVKVTFHLDGTGLVYDPFCPIHLDALLAYCLAPMHEHSVGLMRDDPPDDIPLPVGKWRIGSEWGWMASALFPNEILLDHGDLHESLMYWRKRMRQGRMDWTSGSPNLQNGVYREYNHPFTNLICNSMVGFCIGKPNRIHRLLQRNIRYLGKKRAYGRGKVTGIEVEAVDYDYSLARNGLAMRWLPDPRGMRHVRPRPPYWNCVGRVACCEVGDDISGLLHIEKTEPPPLD